MISLVVIMTITLVAVAAVFIALVMYPSFQIMMMIVARMKKARGYESSATQISKDASVRDIQNSLFELHNTTPGYVWSSTILI